MAAGALSHHWGTPAATQHLVIPSAPSSDTEAGSLGLGLLRGEVIAPPVSLYTPISSSRGGPMPPGQQQRAGFLLLRLLI